MKKRTKATLILVVGILCVAAIFGSWYYHFVYTRYARPRLKEIPKDIWAFVSESEGKPEGKPYTTARLAEFHLRQIVELPGGAEAVLETAKEGSSDGDTECVVSAAMLFAVDDPYPHLIRLSKSVKPETRRFAVWIMGTLIDKRYIPRLKEMLNDNGVLFGDAGLGPVGDYAKRAIKNIERFQDPRLRRLYIRYNDALTRENRILFELQDELFPLEHREKEKTDK